MPDTVAFTAIIAVAAAFIGLGLGWWLRGRSTPDSADKIEKLETELREARDEKVVAQTNLKNLKERFDEEKKRLNEIRSEMENTFKAMASDIAADNSKRFLTEAGEKFKTLQKSSEKHLDEKKKLIDANLSDVSRQLNDIRKQSTELKTTIETSRQTTESLRQDATHLRELLSSSQRRGQWGERMVTDILEMVGLVENINYTRQQQTESGQRPDFTFILPREKKLNMDVKFPLDQYEKYLDAESDEARAQAKKNFLAAVKKHINDVSGRDYINPAEGTLDYVMLFIPNESIYGFINSEDSQLVDNALKQRVLLCSPLTLYAMLSMIHQATRNFAMNERVVDVLNLVEKFREQWGKYVEQMDKMGRSIDRLSADYKTLVTTRTRALENPMEKIENITHTNAIDTDSAAQLPDADDSQDD